ncbi:hypothetical protein [Subtercola frigoramans]|uniref:Uncharacterized protein n=1 Tax=Subtercola frigoramans TaxID=120298 RepID=A0ABS2L5X6_9MICO|nr:hypothetical protein [Subtercola frigoramans]MBM7472500.1 hypothetical protein [Subtercola frigoramans]
MPRSQPRRTTRSYTRANDSGVIVFSALVDPPEQQRLAGALILHDATSIVTPVEKPPATNLKSSNGEARADVDEVDNA